MTRSLGPIVFMASVAIVAGIFTLFPGLDLAAARWFYRDGFFLANDPVLHFVYRAVFWITDALAVALVSTLLAILVRQRPLFGLDRLAAIYLIVALAIGPGFAVNTLLKDHWGRARPSQIVEFGGSKQFTPALVPTDQCQRNCSFPAGHPATVFYFTVFALLIPSVWPRRLVFAGAILAGAAVGAVRMAQGAHFLSDVVFSGLIVFGIGWLLHLLMVRRGGIAALGGKWRLVAVGAICFIAGAVSYFFYDRPVAVAARHLSPIVHRVFAAITQLGYSDGYLVVGAVAFVLFFFILRRWRREAWRAAFLFLNVAISGLAGDLVKVIVARDRPKLFFLDGEYGFNWFRGGADHWSFPSGHAATATAVALSLTLFWPKWWPAWWSVALAVIASRVIINAHYPSDLLGGFYIALLTWCGLRAWFARRNLPLREIP